METHQCQTPSLKDLLRLLDSTRTKQSLLDDSRIAETTSLRLDLKKTSNPVFPNESNTQTVKAMAMKKIPKCYICKKPGHIAPDCPAKKQGNPQVYKPPLSQPTSHPFPPCSVTYNFDKLPYIRPLQPDASASSTSSRPPLDQSKAPAKQVDVKMIDPNVFAEEENEYVFESEDISAKPSGMCFDLTLQAIPILPPK
ncbi:hypothetical protein PGT21_024893 [Puccinia graminis f. sp. tritici]|uniref:CCHC-type domain-containing protein n=1 Tax=Puccinia graminis f. sp. tritici TaxID=56615 RepID=A0A5B0QBE2_PUCGR|nr:hypothetical protein PGT21_024893 [Puccinia graminis f. sp. tritici]